MFETDGDMRDRKDHIREQISGALDAEFENGYEHDFDLTEREIVLQIQDFSGLEDFDENLSGDMMNAELAVSTWRRKFRENNFKVVLPS